MKKAKIKVIGIGKEGKYCVREMVSFDPDTIEIMTNIKDRERISESDFIFIVCNLKKKVINNIKEITNITKDKGIFTILVSNKTRVRMKNTNIDSLIMVSDETPSDKSIIVVKALVDLIAEANNKITYDDIKEILYNKVSIANIGIARGKNRVFRATERAINNSSLKKSFKDTKNIIVDIMGHINFTFVEASTIRDAIGELISEKVNCIYSVENNEQLKQEVVVTIIAN